MALRLTDTNLRPIGRTMRLVVIHLGLAVKAMRPAGIAQRLVGKALSHAGMAINLLSLALRMSVVVLI